MLKCLIFTKQNYFIKVLLVILLFISSANFLFPINRIYKKKEYFIKSLLFCDISVFFIYSIIYPDFCNSSTSTHQVIYNIIWLLLFSKLLSTQYIFAKNKLICIINLYEKHLMFNLMWILSRTPVCFWSLWGCYLLLIVFSIINVFFLIFLTFEIL